MKKILIVQSRQRPEMLQAEQDEYRRALGDFAVPVFVSSLDTTLPWDNPEEMLSGYDGSIVGGSGEFDFDGGRAFDDGARVTSREIVQRTKPLIVHVLEKDFPLLGICYGHQIVAEVLGVPVVNDLEQKKVGTYEVHLTEVGKKDRLLGALPGAFLAQYGHKDSLSSLPKNAVLLASSALCKTSAVRYGQNVYTMQFHPELTKDDVVWKLAHSPGYLPEGTDVHSLIKPSIEASRIIPLFVEKVMI